MVGNPKREWWSKKAPQVYAHYAGDDPGSPARWLPDGAVDKPATFDNPERRTYRQLTKAGLMLCPMKGCGPFATAGQGVKVRSHYRHPERSNAALHRGGPESVWHQQAKFAVYDWLAATVDPAALADLQLDNKTLPLRDDRRRKPDVYVEFKHGACVAFECQQQTMGDTDPRDHRATWQTRMADYRELRETLGLQVVWLVSPWSTTANLKYQHRNVWRVEAYGGYATQMLEAGECVYL